MTDAEMDRKLVAIEDAAVEACSKADSVDMAASDAQDAANRVLRLVEQLREEIGQDD